MQFNKVIGLVAVVVAASAASWGVFAGTVEDNISNRIKAHGELCMSGEPCAAAPVAAAAGEPRSGEEVYTSKCSVCHSTGAAGAPKFGDAGAWAPRVDKGLDTLYTNAIKGIGGMPAKGLCMDCSDDEIKAGVDHMLENSQ